VRRFSDIGRNTSGWPDHGFLGEKSGQIMGFWGKNPAFGRSISNPPLGRIPQTKGTTTFNVFARRNTSKYADICGNMRHYAGSVIRKVRKYMRKYAEICGYMRSAYMSKSTPPPLQQTDFFTSKWNFKRFCRPILKKIISSES
jgi:hypothetical protein